MTKELNRLFFGQEFCEKELGMKFWNYNDGGREDAGYKGATGDCVVRSIAIAAEMDYKSVYKELYDRQIDFSNTSRSRMAKAMKAKNRTSPREGVARDVIKKYLADMGWNWKATMGIGTGCTVHLVADELPKGRIICSLSKHICAVIDGVIQDTYDCSRDGTRCVYGYWYKD